MLLIDLQGKIIIFNWKSFKTKINNHVNQNNQLLLK